jgi:hypothetical protein
VPPERGPPDPIVGAFPGPPPPPLPRAPPPPAPTLRRHAPLHRRLLAAEAEVGLLWPLVFTTLVAAAICKIGPAFIALAEGG